MKQIIGAICGKKYVLRITPVTGTTKQNAELTVSDREDDVIYQINRGFDSDFGPWTQRGIQWVLLWEAREGLA